jgi:hypothetical protein
MPDLNLNAQGAPLQFDRVTPAPGTDVAAGATCQNCQSRIEAEYYEANGHVICEQCREGLEAAIAPPRGAGPTILAALFGVGAGIVGAAIYYAVIAIAHLQIGIVAILIGYMVGYAVRRGAGNRGGRRLQVLAVALTYLAVAFAYTPFVIAAAVEKSHEPAAASATPSETNTPTAAAQRPGISLLRLLVSIGLIAALPVIVIVSSMPSGLITAFIIFIGMRQAWRMTARPELLILGPFRVGSQPAPLTP